MNTVTRNKDNCKDLILGYSNLIIIYKVKKNKLHQ